MSRPTLYHARKQYAEPHEVDRIQVQRTVEPCCAPGHERPVDFEVTCDYIPVQRIGFSSVDNYAAHFGLLDVDVRKRDNPQYGRSHDRYIYDHEIRVALDEELKQLFNFMRKQERLSHENVVADKNREIDHWKARNNDNLELLQQACDREVALHNELIELKRPWWLKLWEALTTRQEP